MKHLTILALVLAQLPSVPSMAATIDDAPQVGGGGHVRTGTFTGARVRLATGGSNKATRLRAGLTFSAMQSGRSSRGTSVTRFGEGMEFGFSNTHRLGISMAGHNFAPQRSLVPTGVGRDGDKRGLSTLAIVGISLVGIAAVGLATVFLVCVNDSGECGSD